MEVIKGELASVVDDLEEDSKPRRLAESLQNTYLGNLEFSSSRAIQDILLATEVEVATLRKHVIEPGIIDSQRLELIVSIVTLA